MNRRAAFLDRDGVINRKPPEGQYVTRWEEMHFLPGVAKAIGLLNRAGFRVIVVSNQRCVAKGLLTACEMDSMHQRMCDGLAATGATIDEVYYCPHETQPPCCCRKPRPGMLLEAAHKYEIDLSASWMIGDSETDVQTGRNAGCKTARLLNISETASHDADIAALSLLDAVRQVLEREEPNADCLAMDPKHRNDRAPNAGTCSR
jgi:D-glycero-D-manno-heptose 1,7-bisphosphate phosphatase